MVAAGIENEVVGAGESASLMIRPAASVVARELKMTFPFVSLSVIVVSLPERS